MRVGSSQFGGIGDDKSAEVAMPGRQRSHNLAAGDRDYRAELDGALKLARKRLSRGRTLRSLFITFPVPVLAAAVWVALAKFTLLDLPWWPVLLAPLVWLPALGVWLARRPITRSKCARYLDTSLELDERMITCLELGARARLGVPVAAASTFVETLFADTVEVIQQRLYLLGRPLRGLYPVVPLAKNQALGIAIMSYNGRLGFGLLGDYDAMADLDALRADLEASIRALAAAAGIAPRRAPRAARIGVTAPVRG